MATLDVENYEKCFPKYPAPVTCPKTGWVHGVWMIGNNFKSKSGYYGEYPPGFVERIAALFPDAKKVLHLFSGMVGKGAWPNSVEFTFDRREDLNPDVCGDAHNLSSYFKDNIFDLIVADPPYTEEDAKHYGTSLISRNKVIQQCYPILKRGGYIAWLDQAYPMHRKDQIKLVGTIGVWRSTNHRFRGLSIFKSVKPRRNKRNGN